MEFSVGQKLSILYQGENNTEGPKLYDGIVDRITTPKTTNKQLLTIKIAEGEFRNIYPHKAFSIFEKK